MADSNGTNPAAADLANLKIKLEKAELKLKIYKNALILTNQHLAIANTNNSASREKLVFTGSDNNGGKNPLEHLPKEIWTSVLDCYLKGWNDRKNCYDTCQLFRNLLEDSKHCWLFEAVFPFIKSYLKKKGVLKLRQVCKTWRHVIDSMMTGFNVISFPFCSDEMQQLYQQWEQMRDHPCNPFIGGHVEVVHDPYAGDEYNNYHPMIDPDGSFGKQFVEFVSICLSGLSQHITSLNVVLYNDAHFNQLELTQIVVSCLGQCKNLREFCIKGGRYWDPVENDVINESELDEIIPADFKVCQGLTALTIKHLQDLDIVQIPILQQCSSQLKRFETKYTWTKLHANLDWSSLENLTCCRNSVNPTEEQLLEWISQIKAPKLVSLGMRNIWNGSLKNLLLLITKFPKLQYISIAVLADPALQRSWLSQVAQIADNMKPSRSLEEMKIRFDFLARSERLDLTFMICFPWVKRLKLTHTRRSRTFLTNEILRKYKYGDQLSGQWVELEELYKLDMWKWMPFLEALTVYRTHSKKTTFTRRGYNEFIKICKNE